MSNIILFPNIRESIAVTAKRWWAMGYVICNTRRGNLALKLASGEPNVR